MNKDKNGITSKWLINGIEGFCIGSDKKLYKFPFQSGKNHYGLKQISEDKKHRRYRINGKWWSKKQLKSKIYLNPNPEVIIKTLNDCPF